MNTNNGGVTNIDVLSVGALYVNGQRLKDLITSLISQDAFEQVEIDEIKLLLQYLNTSGLSSEWILDNNNKNQDLKTSINLLNTRLLYYDGTALSENWIINNDNRNVILKTAIDLINTRLLYIDTTALSQSSILNNDNRNSVLKTRIDGNDGSLATLNSKTQYITHRS
jgi:hypothetical protein